MPRQSNYSIEDRIKACEDYISGKRSIRELCNSLGIRHTKTVTRWVKQYRENGAEVFLYKVTNKSYSSEVKISAVTEYLSGGLSIEDVCNKYNICAQNTLKRWIVMYNSNMELNDDRRKREIYMAESGRKTTQAERKEIVEYCISNSCDYKETAEKYKVSYSQVYSWVKKYELAGEDGLADKRGQHKADSEVDELERLHREVTRLKRQLEEKDMVVDLLKKVKEYKGRGF